MFYSISKPLLVKRECFVELQKIIWENNNFNRELLLYRDDFKNLKLPQKISTLNTLGSRAERP